MWTSSIAVAARIAPSPASAPAQTRTSIGRSRLPPAASVASASAASSAPPSATTSPSRRSTAAMRRGNQLSAASSTWVTGGGTLLRVIGPGLVSQGAVRAQGRRAPEWIAMIPPASTV